MCLQAVDALVIKVLTGFDLLIMLNHNIGHIGKVVVYLQETCLKESDSKYAENGKITSGKCYNNKAPTNKDLEEIGRFYSAGKAINYLQKICLKSDSK